MIAIDNVSKVFTSRDGADAATRGDDFIRAGNWYKNQTTWRMCIDLNRCLYYSDANGQRFEASCSSASQFGCGMMSSSVKMTSPPRLT